jgi:hypothetical protein
VGIVALILNIIALVVVSLLTRPLAVRAVDRAAK